MPRARPAEPRRTLEMTDPVPIQPESVPAILALNNMFAVELSLLDRDRLEMLLREAFYARCLGGAEGFLIAFDPNAAYDSPNFGWFRDRYERFVYVDRLAVAPHRRGGGLARRLYADLLRHAAAAGHDRVGCEVNAEPPNPASDALHAALGFTLVGAASLAGSGKTVRYLTRQL